MYFIEFRSGLECLELSERVQKRQSPCEDLNHGILELGLPSVVLQMSLKATKPFQKSILWDFRDGFSHLELSGRVRKRQSPREDKDLPHENLEAAWSY